MRHDITVAGYSYRIRPVVEADAAAILALRIDPERCRYLHRTSPSLAAQQKWLQDYFQRVADYYFIVERHADGGFEGTIGLYNFSPDRSSAEWGRFIIRRGSRSALEALLLLHRVAFDTLHLQRVYCRVAVANVHAVAFYERFGLRLRKILPRFFDLGERLLDALELEMTVEGWHELRDGLERSSRELAARHAALPASVGDAHAASSTP